MYSLCELLEELHPEIPEGIASYKDLITFVKGRPGHDLRYAIDASKIERATEMGLVDHPVEVASIPSSEFRTLGRRIHD